MKARHFARFAGVGAALISGWFSAQVKAYPVPMFVDDFNANHPNLNAVPVGWSVDGGGYVDIIGFCDGVAYYNIMPGNGCYIDLDGSGGTPGQLTRSLSLKGGRSYELRFRLAGSQNAASSSDTVRVGFGSETQTYTLAYTDPFSVYAFSFNPLTNGSYAMSFLNLGAGDTHGILLDDVSVTDSQARDHTDLPAPLPLLGAGTAYAFSRRLRRRIRSTSG